MKRSTKYPQYLTIIIFVVVFVTTKQLIRHYNKEALPTFDTIMDTFVLMILFFASTFKINDTTKGTVSNLPKYIRIAILVIGISLLSLKIYLNVENITWFKNQIPIINTVLFGLISFNYFNVIDTDEKRKKLTNFLKYLFAFIALANLSTVIF